MHLPSEEQLKDISVAIAILKSGAEISYNRKGKRVRIQNGSPISDNYQERNYLVKDFLLLESLGFLRLDSANW